jgi:glycosyltransferase involved in cell wall biosynthesis
MIYIANIRYPTEKAHGIQIAKTCEALIKAGTDLVLWVPRRSTPIKEEPEPYYGLSLPIPARRFFTLDTVGLGRIGFVVQSLSFALACAYALQSKKGEVVYCRDEIVLWLLSYLSQTPCIWESHDGQWTLFAKRAAKTCRRLVVVTEGAKRLYISRGVPESKIAVIRNGIDLASFVHRASKEAARSRLGLPQDKKIALYAGRLDGWKGIDTLLESSKSVGEGVLLALIGGEEEQIRVLSARYHGVRFLGYRPYAELASNLSAADVLVLPNTAKSGISLDLTSPLKLMAYMAAGLPIVASDLPSVRELIDEGSGYLVTPDDTEALSTGIREALFDPEAPVRAARAKARAQDLSWERRGEKIQAML